MIETGTAILYVVAASLSGVVLGAFLHKQFGNAGSKARDLSQKLEEARENNERYQRNVADHFSKTATLLNDLTLQYRDIHQHLASGADELCKDESGESLLTGLPIELSINAAPGLESSAASNAEVQPPLDYAPKEETNQTGVLSEEFGLEKVSSNSSPDSENNAPAAAVDTGANTGNDKSETAPRTPA